MGDSPEQTDTSLSIGHLEARLSEVLEAVRKPNECIAKELRQFPVMVHPVYIQLSDHLNYLSSNPHLTTAEPSPLDSLLGHLQGLLFAGINEVVEETDPIIHIGLSKRTRVPGTRCVIRAYVKTLLRQLRAKNGRIAVLTELTDALGENLDAYTVSEGGEEREFFSDLRRVLREGTNQPLLVNQLHREFSSRWHKSSRAILRTRFYLSRGDYRAFYVERDLVRHVVGAIVVRMLLPKSQAKRAKALFSRTYPVHEKDRLHYTLLLPQGIEMRLILGDISSFTSSAIGFPALAMLMLDLWKVVRSELPPSIVVSIDGELMEADVGEALRIFLRRTVWAPVQVEDTSFVSAGGYLGLTGNINLTLTSFAFLVRLFEESCRTSFPSVRITFKLGGDDFCTILRGDPTEVDQAAADFLAFVQRYVGHLKMSPIIDPTKSEGIVGSYCKRQVVTSVSLSQDQVQVSVDTLENIPIPEQLFQDFTKLGESEAREAAQSFFNCLRQASYRGDLSERLVQDLLYILEEVQGMSLCVTQPLSLRRGVETVIQHQRNTLTPSAYAVVCAIPSVSTRDGRSVRTTFKNQLSFALSRDFVSIRKVRDGQQVVELVLTSGEARRLHSDRVALIERRTPLWDFTRVINLVTLIRREGLDVVCQ